MSIPYAKIARALAPRPTHTIEALGHRFIPSGQEEMLCRSCGFVIWKVETPEEAAGAVRGIAGFAKHCPASSDASCRFCGATGAEHEPSGCCGDGGGSTFAQGGAA